VCIDMTDSNNQSAVPGEGEPGLDPLDLVDDLDDAEDSEYDQELGRRMGIDAMRVANGELDEQEFHEKYESELIDEFGEDYSPAEVMGNE
jgi:hypothetical protein